MAEKTPDIAVVRRTYNGLEGRRVKAGTRFAIGQERGGLQVITRARFQTLLASKLVRPFGEEDTGGGAKQARPTQARTVTTMEGPGGKTARGIREAARKRVKADTQPPNAKPGAPKQIKGPVASSTSPGSQTGAASASSSSRAAQVPGSSTGKKSGRRGTRGAAPSEVPGAAGSAPASPSSPSTTR